MTTDKLSEHQLKVIEWLFVYPHIKIELFPHMDGTPGKVMWTEWSCKGLYGSWYPGTPKLTKHIFNALTKRGLIAPVSFRMQPGWSEAWYYQLSDYGKCFLTDRMNNLSVAN